MPRSIYLAIYVTPRLTVACRCTPRGRKSVPSGMKTRQPARSWRRCRCSICTQWEGHVQRACRPVNCEGYIVSSMHLVCNSSGYGMVRTGCPWRTGRLPGLRPFLASCPGAADCSPRRPLQGTHTNNMNMHRYNTRTHHTEHSM
jgi:hypothetical protein